MHSTAYLPQQTLMVADSKHSHRRTQLLASIHFSQLGRAIKAEELCKIDLRGKTASRYMVRVHGPVFESQVS